MRRAFLIVRRGFCSWWRLLVSQPQQPYVQQYTYSYK